MKGKREVKIFLKIMEPNEIKKTTLSEKKDDEERGMSYGKN